MTWLYQWATYEPRDGITTVDDLWTQGWEQCGIDPRYGSILMRREVEEGEAAA